MSDEQQPPQLPEFSQRLGAPIATVRPAGKPPSQVTGRPDRQAHQEPQERPAQKGAADPAPKNPEGAPAPPRPADLGVLPGPDGRPVEAEDGADQVDPNSFYAQVGGRETFQKIVDAFYAQVAEDEDFRAMYPEEDLEPAKRRLLTFLEQYWGGPRTYQAERGHPRLRMRHMPFKVDAEARDKWLKFMGNAVKEAGLSPMHEEILWDYLDRAAHSMVNA